MDTALYKNLPLLFLRGEESEIGRRVGDGRDGEEGRDSAGGRAGERSDHEG